MRKIQLALVISTVAIGASVAQPLTLWAAGQSAEKRSGKESMNRQELITMHREAAAKAREKVAYHEEMEKNAIAGKWGGKFDMVGHCRFWADHYRKLAAKEEQAARELE